MKGGGGSPNDFVLQPALVGNITSSELAHHWQHRVKFFLVFSLTVVSKCDSSRGVKKEQVAGLIRPLINT